MQCHESVIALRCHAALVLDEGFLIQVLVFLRSRGGICFLLLRFIIDSHRGRRERKCGNSHCQQHCNELFHICIIGPVMIF